MKLLNHQEQSVEYVYLTRARDIARQATCTRSRCGSIIIKDGQLIGMGYNSPPQGLESQRRCDCEKSSYDPKVTDKTCCVHAEERAIMDALRRAPDRIEGSRLYFVRIPALEKAQSMNSDEGYAGMLYSGQPYCTICSKLALDMGIAEFVLFGEDGIRVYDTQEYNDISYKFRK